MSKGVNTAQSNAQRVKVGDTGSTISISLQNTEGDAVTNIQWIRAYSSATMSPTKYVDIPSYDVVDGVVYLQLPEIERGEYVIELKDDDGRIYPAEGSIKLTMISSTKDAAEVYYVSYKDLILNEVEGMVEEYILENPDGFKGPEGDITHTDQMTINKGKTYPLLITKLDGVEYPLADEVKNTVLSAKVIGARKDKFYAIQYIGNGLSGKYGISLAEYDRDDDVGISWTKRRTLIEFGDGYFNHEKPEGDIVHRTIHIPNENLSFEIVYDRSEITQYTFGLNFSNTTEGKARSSVIHPANYVYRMESESTETIISSNSGKVFMDKKTDRFFVYKPVSNGNYVGHEITHYERGTDAENKLSNYNLWCVRTIKEYSRSGNSFTPVRSFIDDSTPTTMDLMIKESNDMDYMGGIHHGDEVSDFAMLLVDGKPIDLSSTGFYEAKEIRLIQRNKLYRDSIYTGGILEHLGTAGKEHVFNCVDGYTLHNTVTWHESINIVQAFLGSLSLYRKDEKGNSPLWHTAINDITHTPYDLTTVGGQMSTAVDVERVILLGENVSCIVDVDRLDNIPGNPTWVANFADHNSKLYISYVPNGYTTEVDEVWKQSTKFNFELN